MNLSNIQITYCRINVLINRQFKNNLVQYNSKIKSYLKNILKTDIEIVHKSISYKKDFNDYKLGRLDRF